MVEVVVEVVVLDVIGIFLSCSLALAVDQTFPLHALQFSMSRCCWHVTAVKGQL